MYVLGVRADKLTDNDIQRLIENQVPEQKTLEYKKELHFAKDADKKEFLFDISAMYNTDGGCIIYGIEEEKDSNSQNTGKPQKISGIQIENTDKLIQQIEDVVKNNTEPSINHLVLQIISIEEKMILVLGIPKCIGLPTMVTFNQSNKFFKRRNSGKYAVDVYELNAMFMQNQMLIQKAEKFRMERIQNVLSQNCIPNLHVQHAILIHIIPINFLENQLVDFSILAERFTTKMRPIHARGWNYMYNLDGFAVYSSEDFNRSIVSYNQLLRNGSYEIFSSELFYPTRHNDQVGFNGFDLIQEVIRCISEGIEILNQVKIEAPFFVSFSLHNVKDTIMDNDRRIMGRFSKNEIIFPFILFPNYESNPKTLLKPIFDILWQSFGQSKCPDIP